MTYPRRILYVLSRFPNVSTTFIANEMTALTELGADIHIAAIWRSLDGEPHATERAFLNRLMRPNIRSLWLWITALAQIIRKPSLIGVILRLMIGHTVSMWALIKLLVNIPKGLMIGAWVRAHKIDHIHAHFLTAPATVALIASKVSGVPFTVTVHAFDLYDDSPRNRNGSVRYKLESAARVVCISAYNRRYLTRFSPFPTQSGSGEKLHVVYNGISLDLFSPPPIRRPIPRHAHIVSNGSLIAKKGHDVLIRAVAALHAAGYRVTLDIIGRGALEPALRALATELGLTDAVTFAGIMTQTQVVERYHAADVFALACIIAPDGDRDGIPTVLIEALAVELPTVSTTVSGVPEVIIDGETGRCVEPTPIAIADAIRGLIDQPDQTRAMAQRGRAHVRARFDRDNNARRLYDVFESAQEHPVGESPAQ